jgi:hypothetical protein
VAAGRIALNLKFAWIMIGKKRVPVLREDHAQTKRVSG